MTTSQDWWPADFGHYGGFMIRMAWHSSGTYRVGDGRGGAGTGTHRFAPLNSWPDNANLDKARLLLWPIKEKYGRKISWADLMILAGNVALESMGFPTIGFAGGREDVWEPEQDIYWGSETGWLDNDQRYDTSDGKLEGHLGAVHMGLYKSGVLQDTITSGIEGAWTPNPIQWDGDYFDVLLNYDWELTKSPAGAHQWAPTAASNARTAPNADGNGQQALMMTTADMALKVDPEYKKISERFHNDHQAFEDAFAKAWFKLTHRDLGPVDRYLGPEVPKEAFIWQDPVPKTDYKLSDDQINSLKNKLSSSGLTISEMVKTAWASASTFRGSDMRGGANGSHIRLEPMCNWEVNHSAELQKVLTAYENIRSEFDGTISMADLIVLAGNTAVENAANKAGHTIKVPFSQGRGDASQEQTDALSFSHLEPLADGFRNYMSNKLDVPAEDLLIDKANLLTLTIPEMTSLVGGLRVLGANYDNSSHGVFTDRKGQLSNDFFKNLLDFKYTWKATAADKNIFEGTDRRSGETKFTGTRVDLIFGSNTELRAVSEVYGASDGI